MSFWKAVRRSCLALQGWLVVDRVVLAQNTITALEARFEQRCQGSAGVLRGALRWTAPERIPAPQPLSAPGDWSADALLPASGNVLHVESGRADNMGGRLTQTATPLDALLTVHETGGLLAVESNGEQRHDPTQPPGPVLPVPAALWKPAADTTPSSGTYLYMQSLPGDFVGAGQTTLFTPASAPFVVTPRDRGLDIEVGNLLTGWRGHLEPMSRRQRLEPGYDPALKQYPVPYNPARGGLSWSGLGRGCNELTGWFVVDAVSYTGNTLTSLQARFEQYCDGSPSPLRGEIRWSR